MPDDGGHFEPRSGSLNTILAVDHLRTIDDMFAILADWFQRRRFQNIFPIGSYVKTMSADGGHFGWRSGSLDIILKVFEKRLDLTLPKLTPTMHATSQQYVIKFVSDLRQICGFLWVLQHYIKCITKILLKVVLNLNTIILPIKTLILKQV